MCCVALGSHLRLGILVVEEVRGLAWVTSVLGKVERGVAHGPNLCFPRGQIRTCAPTFFLLRLMGSGWPLASLLGLTKSHIFLL